MSPKQGKMFPLSDEEKDRLTKRLYETVLEKARTEDTKKLAMKQFNEEIKILDEKAHSLALDLRDAEDPYGARLEEGEDEDVIEAEEVEDDDEGYVVKALVAAEEDA